MTDRSIYTLTGHINPTDLLTLADGQAVFPPKTAVVTTVNNRTGNIAILSGDITAALGFTPQAAGSFLQTGNNLSDIGNAITARANLGLKSGAIVNISIGTVAPSSPVTNDLWVDTN